MKTFSLGHKIDYVDLYGGLDIMGRGAMHITAPPNTSRWISYFNLNDNSYLLGFRPRVSVNAKRPHTLIVEDGGLIT